MKGAVQGVAATAASAPVKKVPAWPDRAVSPWPNPVIRPPTSQTPDSASASAKKRYASSVTMAGDWSWKPQPIWSPPARSVSRAPASAPNASSTPAV